MVYKTGVKNGIWSTTLRTVVVVLVTLLCSEFLIMYNYLILDTLELL